MISVVEALPVLAELGQAVGVDVLDAIYPCQWFSSAMELLPPQKHRQAVKSCDLCDIHAGGTSGDSSALLQALKLSSAGVLVLALHVVIVVVAASGTDEERGGEERRRASTDLLNSGDVVGQRSGVDEHLLGESDGWIG